MSSKSQLFFSAIAEKIAHLAIKKTMTSFIFTLSIKLMSPVNKVWNETCFAYLKKALSVHCYLHTSITYSLWIFLYLCELPLIFCSRVMFVYILVCLNSYYYICFVLLSVNTNLHFHIPLHRPCLLIEQLAVKRHKSHLSQSTRDTRYYKQSKISFISWS